MTFLMVTHDQDEAMTMADRIAMMEKGRLIQVGTPARSTRRPPTGGRGLRGRHHCFEGDVEIVDGPNIIGLSIRECRRRAARPTVASRP